jgi:uncharacterized protein (DUF1810 family)
MIRTHDLQRFIEAQDPIYRRVCAELAAAEKTSHWMWFVFPQLKGLGHSAKAEHFGITSKDEAVAYLQHPVLGARLRECTRIVLDSEGTTAARIFGSPDDMKFRSSMTLFAAVADEPLFRSAIEKYFDGDDQRTITMLQRAG